MSSEEEFRELSKLSGDIGQYLFDEWCTTFGTFDFGGQEYEALSAEDYEELGYPDDPAGPLIIRRIPDGKCFEVELEANVCAVLPKAERERQAVERGRRARRTAS